MCGGLGLVIGKVTCVCACVNTCVRVSAAAGGVTVGLEGEEAVLPAKNMKVRWGTHMHMHTHAHTPEHVFIPFLVQEARVNQTH